MSERSYLLVSGCIFSLNTASNQGGGMFNQSQSLPVIRDCLFSANDAVRGGGMYSLSSSAVISRTGFQNNDATDQAEGKRAA